MGNDPWIGGGGDFRLPQDLVEDMIEQGIIFLSQICDPVNTTYLSQEWLSPDVMEIEEEEENMVAWNKYIKDLKDNHNRLKDCEDVLIWSRNSPSHGYSVITEEDEHLELLWWHSTSRSYNCPLK